MNPAESEKIADADRDSLHILPLHILPLETPVLNHARLIKNVRLESVVELFAGPKTGSGQIEIESLPLKFNWGMNEQNPDMDIMRGVGALPSYDVYSLRIALRNLDIVPDDQEALKLSDAMRQELTPYMVEFTRPLIFQVFGGDDTSIKSFDDLINLFRSPDVKNALEKIHVMADKLDIKPEQIPKFMEDYGDIYLSLSYYRRCLDVIEPIVADFFAAMDTIRSNYQFKTNPSLRKTMNEMQSNINGSLAGVAGRFENFETGTKQMWDDISAERFRKVENLISSYHTTIGGVLCSLSVKMDAWARTFPTSSSGGPGKRVEFIMSEMKQGMDKIRAIEDSAPMLSVLEKA